jgi:hypothetical protein
MTTSSDEGFHVGLLRQIARAIGWDKLKALVEKLAAEDAPKGRNP